MKVSIIVPVYNVENYLEDCLQSLLNQTLDDYEIICVNDGSTDHSLDILNRYSAQYSDKITVLSIENSGQGQARNCGIEIARGDYIGFIDSDDWVDLTMFDKLYQAAIAGNADIAVCRVCECTEDGSSVSDESPDSRIEDISSCVVNKIYRRSLIKNIRFPAGLWYEDFAFGIQAVTMAKSFAYVEEGLYFYRIGHVSTMSNRNALKNLDIISILDIVFDYYQKNHLNMESYEYLVLSHALTDAIRRVAMMNVSESGHVIRQIRSYVHTRIPDLSACKAYKEAPTGKKIALFLNYHGLQSLTMLIIKLKSGVKS